MKIVIENTVCRCINVQVNVLIVINKDVMEKLIEHKLGSIY